MEENIGILVLIIKQKRIEKGDVFFVEIYI
jgi:hypothetical protein